MAKRGPKILFITSTRIGDAVLTTGVVDQLVTEHPDVKITIAAGPLALPLFRLLPQAENLIPLVKRRRGLHWLKLWQQTVTSAWDQIIDIRGTSLGFCLRTKRRAIWRSNSDIERRNDHRIIELQRWLKLIVPPAPRLWWGHDEIRAAAAMLPDTRPFLAVGPIANWSPKEWPIENYGALLKRLTASNGRFPDAPIIIFGAPHEREAAQPLITMFPANQIIDATGVGDLLIVAAMLEKSALYLGNDSGLMHLAAAAGAPTLGLFGPSNEQRYAPWGHRAEFIRTPEAYDVLIRRAEANPTSRDSLLQSLTVDRVEAAVYKLLEKLDHNQPSPRERA